MKVMVSGGGTGGHLYPALAIGDAYRRRGDDVMYVGSRFGLEKDILPQKDIPFELLSVRGLRGNRLLTLPRSLWLMARAFAKAKKLVRAFGPDLIVGTGGYASFPVLKAGEALGVPTLLHEANAEPGKANLELAQKADVVCLNYAETAHRLKDAKKIVITGMPIRDAVLMATRQEGGAYLGVDDETTVVVVTGGSQGSRHINDAMVAYYATFNGENVVFYHLVGKNNGDQLAALDFDFVRGNLYEERMDLVLARADICLGRAGASFLAEIAAVGVAAILVPYPFSHGHQEKNAVRFADLGAAEVVFDGELATKLKPTLDGLLSDEARRRALAAAIKKEARPDALARIVEAGITAGKRV